MVPQSRQEVMIPDGGLTRCACAKVKPMIRRLGGAECCQADSESHGQMIDCLNFARRSVHSGSSRLVAARGWRVKSLAADEVGACWCPRALLPDIPQQFNHCTTPVLSAAHLHGCFVLEGCFRFEQPTHSLFVIAKNCCGFFNDLAPRCLERVRLPLNWGSWRFCGSE